MQSCLLGQSVKSKRYEAWNSGISRCARGDEEAEVEEESGESD